MLKWLKVELSCWTNKHTNGIGIRMGGRKQPILFENALEYSRTDQRKMNTKIKFLNQW